MVLREMASSVGSLWSHAIRAEVAYFRRLQLPVFRLLSQEVLPDDLELSQLRITSGDSMASKDPGVSFILCLLTSAIYVSFVNAVTCISINVSFKLWQRSLDNLGPSVQEMPPKSHVSKFVNLNPRTVRLF